MFNLKNKLQVKVSAITHDYNNGIFSIEFRAIPITGEIVEVDYTQWRTFSVCIDRDKYYFTNLIGFGIADLINNILDENKKYQQHTIAMENYSIAYDSYMEELNKWEQDNTLVKPVEPEKPVVDYILEFEELFKYINEIGIIEE